MKSYITLIVIAVFLGLAGMVAVLLKQNAHIKIKNSNLTLNIKSLEYGIQAYKDTHGNDHTLSLERSKSRDELDYSYDSVSNRLKAQLKLANAKIKNVTQIGTISTVARQDTLVVMTTKDSTYDLSQKPYLIEIISIKNDTLSRKLELYNDQTLIHKVKRETIRPPKKFFIAKWLQKKHDVTYVDIVNSNPLIKTTEQTFILMK